MLKLGRAQGVAIAAAAYRNLSIHEYAPLKIKMSLTGNGMASKEQIAEMVRKLLKVQKEEMSTFFDATDGVAAAICHFFQSRNTVQEKKFNSWTDFVAQNKSKVSRPARTAKTVKNDNSQ
jgi:crossover junction endodeoxyribonuclease RuvC